LPKGDIVVDASNLASSAAASNVPIRLMGGIAVYLRCEAIAKRPELARAYADIDIVAPKRAARDVADLLTKAGYTPNRQFNALNGSSRLLFFDEPQARQIDIFLGRFSMCHALDLEPRFDLPGPALSPSDLLLLKLQIVELNAKDVTDALTLLLSYEPKADDSIHHLSTDYINKLCASDWGWYTTLRDNLQTVAERAAAILPKADAGEVRRRVSSIVESLDGAPKSLGWKLRDRIGRRKAWYELPEEVRR
jgi:hypothetical protein